MLTEKRKYYTMTESFYRTRLAYIHDTYYGDIARGAAQEILNHSNTFSLKKVIDIGCGSGILASILSQNGKEVIGIDISSDLLEIAKVKSPQTTFIHASLFDYPFDYADIFCAIGEPFNYLFDEKASYKALRKILQTIYVHLTPSGLFLFDILTDEVETTNNIRIVEKEDITMFLEISVDAKKEELTRKMTFFIKRNNCYEKDSETHKQLLFKVDKIEELLAETGFNFQRLTGYNGLEFRKGHYGFICKK